MYSADDGMSSITPFKVRFSPSIYVVGENEYLYIGRPDKNVILYSSNPRSTTFTYDRYLFFSGSDNNKTVDIYIGDVDPEWEGARYIKLN